MASKRARKLSATEVRELLASFRKHGLMQSKSMLLVEAIIEQAADQSDAGLGDESGSR